MTTVVKKTDDAVILQAAEFIKSGGIVAFPTETVYGLGADALNPSAVKKIFKAKGRPSDNPLIVHIEKKDDVYDLAQNISKAAENLIAVFWPGPLTLVFEKKEIVPFETSGGLNTVAIRLPSNETARLLCKHSGVPIAAPSANTSGKPSPTKAAHVIDDLMGKIDMIIDGGDSVFGLESTIVDVSEDRPALLRPGSITIEMLREYVDLEIGENLSPDAAPKAPGMKYKHYAPKAELTVLLGNRENIALEIETLIKHSNKKIGLLLTKQTAELIDAPNCTVLVSGDIKKPETVAFNLYNRLRQFDEIGVDVVYTEGFGDNDVWFSIMNRLEKAAGYKIINV